MVLTLVAALSVVFVLLIMAWVFFYYCRDKKWLFVSLAILGSLSVAPIFLTIYLAFYLWIDHAPSSASFETTNYNYFNKVMVNDSGRAVMHVVRVDLTKARVWVSPPVRGEEYVHNAMTTSSALIEYQADIAVNGSFFLPFKDNNLLDYYPHPGDEVFPIGSTYYNFKRYGKYEDKWHSLVVFEDGSVDIVNSIERQDIAGKIKYGLSGRRLLLKNGLTQSMPGEGRYPRAVVGVNSEKSLLWLVVVDGKQPNYSDGIQLNLLSEELSRLGVETALELDGGGSATLVIKQGGHSAKVLNRPIHTKTPHRERPVANHLLIGFK